MGRLVALEVARHFVEEGFKCLYSPPSNAVLKLKVEGEQRIQLQAIRWQPEHLPVAALKDQSHCIKVTVAWRIDHHYATYSAASLASCPNKIFKDLLQLWL